MRSSTASGVAVQVAECMRRKPGRAAIEWWSDVQRDCTNRARKRFYGTTKQVQRADSPECSSAADAGTKHGRSVDGAPNTPGKAQDR